MPVLLSSARRAGVVLLAVALFPAPGHGQLRNDPTNAISKDDPIYPPLAAYQTAMQRREEEGKQFRSTFQDWIRVDSPAAARLFPNLRFASLRWDMHRHPEAKGPLALAVGLELVAAIDTTTHRVVRELWCHGNHEEFGKLLVDHKVTLRDATEAKLVWDASCVLYGQGSKTAPLKKMSASEWRLGISSYDQTTSVVDGVKTVVTRTHYTRVLVDPKTARITSWESRVDSSNERKMSAN
jgi:hypothetical protein